MSLKLSFQLVRREIQHVWWKRTVAARLGYLRLNPVVVIIRNCIEPRPTRRRCTAIADDQSVRADMVEYGCHAFFEQRQPVVHSRQAPAFGYRLIQRIARRGDAKTFAVTGSEPADRFLVHQRLDRRQKVEMVDLVDTALVGGVEAADAFDLIAEEIEPKTNFTACWKQVDDAAAHRKLARFGHRINAKIAV